MKQLCTNMEQIEATRMRMDEIRSKSSELSLRAGHAQSVLQSAEAREALLSQAYNENIVPHLLSVKNVAQSIGDLMEGLKASRTSIEQDLGECWSVFLNNLYYVLREVAHYLNPVAY